MPNSLIITRLKEAMQLHAVNAVELARRADVKTSFIYDVLNGKSANPSTLKLARVAESLGISLSDLVSSQPDPNAMSDYITVPLIAVTASAGGGAVVSTEDEAEYYYFKRSWIRDRLNAQPNSLRLLFVSGDSMEPTLHHGDIILINTANTNPSPPGIFVLFDGFGLMAKRLELVAAEKEMRLRIISDNPNYTTMERSMKDVHIVGRIVWFSREM